MDRMHGAWHNNLIDVGLSVFDDRCIRRRKKFVNEALFVMWSTARNSFPTNDALGQFDVR